jgi:hypothetical protein
MKSLGTILALVLVAGTASAATAGDTSTACRQQWVDLDQLHGENGNPRGPVRALTQRWQALDEAAEEYAASATAEDCGSTIEELSADWRALESFQYDLQAFDPHADLGRAERDRRHALEMGRKLSPEVKRAFRVVRAHTPGAVRDLEPALDGAAGVDLRDPAAVRDFLQRARAIRRESQHVQRMRHPYLVIGNAELNEE